MSAPYTMQALQELADDGVHLLEIDDADLVATVQELDALRARVAELEREKGECVVKLGLECAMTLNLKASNESLRSILALARADAARLREALRKWERVVRDFRAGFGSSRNADDADNALLAFSAALASTPSAEPTPRDMRVAEAVRSACADCCDHDEGSTDRLRELDLAAVVAKAVGT